MYFNAFLAIYPLLTDSMRLNLVLLLLVTERLRIETHVQRQQQRNKQIRGIEASQHKLLIIRNGRIQKGFRKNGDDSCCNMSTVQNGGNSDPVFLEQQTVRGDEEKGSLQQKLTPNK